MSQGRKMLLLSLPLGLFLLMVGFLLKGLFSDPTELSSALVGKPAPTFSLPDIYDLNKRYDERVLQNGPLLLNVWATWCPTCRAEHAFLNQLASEGVTIIGLNYKDDSREAALNWLNTLGDPYQLNLFDADGSVALEFGVYGAPETFFINAAGEIVYRHVGDVNTRNWASTLEPIWACLQRTAAAPGSETCQG